MSKDTPGNIAKERPLSYLPVGLFGAVMGLTGLSVAWQLAYVRYGVPEAISQSIGVVAALAFTLLVGGYLVKLVGDPAAVRSEFLHPIAGNMFGTVLISMLLLPIVLAQVDLFLARCLWTVGVVAMLPFAWSVVDRWMDVRQRLVDVTPAWVVPVVGLIDVPLAMPALHLESMHGLMVFSLAVGLFFAIPLFTLIFFRLVLESPLPASLQPTLMILLAPFAVGTSAYIATTGEVDLFAMSLFALTLFLLVVLGGRLRYVDRTPFRVVWWATSFPLAAAAISGMRIAEAFHGWIVDTVTLCLLAVATLTILWLLVRTVMGILQGELRTICS